LSSNSLAPLFSSLVMIRVPGVRHCAAMYYWYYLHALCIQACANAMLTLTYSQNVHGQDSFDFYQQINLFVMHMIMHIMYPTQHHYCHHTKTLFCISKYFSTLHKINLTHHHYRHFLFELRAQCTGHLGTIGATIMRCIQELHVMHTCNVNLVACIHACVHIPRVHNS